MAQKTFSRRTVVVASTVGAAAALAGTGFAVNQALNGSSADTLQNPAEAVSEDGILDLTLIAGRVPSRIGGSQVTLLGYNGSVPGPTLRVKAGDKVRVKLSNQIGETTNLHTHGLHVSPNGNSDNPMIMVMDGESFQYEYQIPANHPAGTFWYHPHHHGSVTNQTWAGLYGAIVVEDASTKRFETERVLVISDISVASNGVPAGANMMSRMMGREGDHILVNGVEQPQATFKQGATELWRIVNSCVSRNLDLSVVGANAKVVAIDGYSLETPIPATNLFVSPGNRLEIVVEPNASKVELQYTTVAHPDSMGMMGMNAKTYSNYPLVTLSKGAATAGKAAKYEPSTLDDLRRQPVAASRQFVLNMPSMNNMMAMMGSGLEGKFTINGRAFDMARVDTTTSLGNVEEWTIVNQSTMAHPFHLHVWPMQIIEVAGETVPGVRYQDVVNIPTKQSVKVRVHFNDYTGASVYHCHILDHEDLGMMGIIEVS